MVAVDLRIGLRSGRLRPRSCQARGKNLDGLDPNQSLCTASLELQRCILWHITVLVLFVLQLSVASEQEVVWTLVRGTSSSEEARAVAVHDDCYYVAGYTNGDLNGQISFGGNDIFIMGLASNRTVLWTRLYGSSSSDVANGIVASENFLYVTGYVRGDINGQTHIGDDDVVILKLALDGTSHWTRLKGTTFNDAAYSITYLEGFIFVAGYTSGRLDGQESGGSSDIFVSKLSEDGVTVWTVQQGSAAQDVAYSITSWESYVYVAGYTDGVLNGELNSGDRDFFCAKVGSRWECYLDSGARNIIRRLCHSCTCFRWFHLRCRKYAW